MATQNLARLVLVATIRVYQDLPTVAAERRNEVFCFLLCDLNEKFEMAGTLQGSWFSRWNSAELDPYEAEAGRAACGCRRQADVNWGAWSTAVRDP